MSEVYSSGGTVQNEAAEKNDVQQCIKKVVHRDITVERIFNDPS